MHIKNIQNIYQERFKQFDALAIQLQSRYNRLSILRLLFFFVGIFIAIFLFNQYTVWVGIAFLIIFITGFARFIFLHQRILKQSKHLGHLATVNKEEIQVLQHQYTHYDSGKQFANLHHPYSTDLDIFGEYSLFQYLNRTTTSIGRARLAAYLSQPSSQQIILERQAAIKELKDQIDWRQNLQASGKGTEDSPEHLILLKQWLEDEPFVSTNPLLKAALYIVPIWMLLGITLSIYWLSWRVFFLFVSLPALILYKTKSKVDQAHIRTAHSADMLAIYARLLQRVESHIFQTSKLIALQSNLRNLDNLLASKAIQKLAYIIHQLNVRYNVFAVFLNLSSLWDLHWVSSLERWKKKHKTALPKWFEALEEFETLNSFATTYYNNPDWTFPELWESKQLVCTTLGHPLINVSKRVSNGFQTPTQGHIKLVTGSNMAGKSTFLRTVGINIVLAVAGAPVCASSMQLPILHVYTSMRTQDALHESTSSFYAELKRLKVIIEAVEQKNNVYFLMDEILKGTNSKDRHTGSQALIKQLINSEGAGIIATHDLELGKLEAMYNGPIENLRMEVRISNGELHFDYKLEKGVSKSFNATLLMKNMGIAIEEEMKN